jgi:hypothetical protein
MSMDCETCQRTLLDLIHGELAPTLATQAHRHMEQCASCRADLARLTKGLELARQLPIVEPPPVLGERVMALATSHAERVQRARMPSRRSLWQRLLDFVGQFAMTPQVGMATISLLIVAIGVWSVPRLSREPEAAGVTVVNPDPEGQAGPSATLQPAERLDLAVDTRGKRIRSREEALALGRRSEAEAPADDPGLATEYALAAAAAPAAEANAQAGPEQVAPAPQAGPTHAAPSDEAAELAALEPPAKKDLEPKAASESSRRAKASRAADLELDGFGAADSTRSLEGSGAASGQVAAADARFASPPPASNAPAGVASGGAATLSDDAFEYRPSAPTRYEVKSAPRKPGAAKAGGVTSASTLLSEARTQQSSGGCRSALPGYERLISAFPASAEAGEAMLAAASCYQSLGQETLARELLRRALQRPATAMRARAMLAEEPAAPTAAEASERK